MQRTLPAPDTVKADTPLRLEVAAAIAFPDGSMSASGLRRERDRGRLTTERIAGKDYTTLANIERMRELCRVVAKDHVSISAERGVTTAANMPQSGSSATEVASKAQAALRTILGELNERSPPTSQKSTLGRLAAKRTANQTRSQ